MITLDFETFSEAELKKTGAWRYSLDPSTTALCLAYKIDDQTTKVWNPIFESFEIDPETGDYLAPEAIPEDLRIALLTDQVIEAHNSFFEYSIWTNVMTPKFGWPEIPLDRFRDSAAKAAALALPRDLDSLGNALGLPITKDMEGRKIMLKMSKPRKPTKKDTRTRHDDPEDYLKLFDYCATDVETEHKASGIIRELSPNELKLWLLDQEINKRGVFIDIPLAEKALDFLSQYSKKLISELIEVTQGAVTTANQRAKILTFAKSQGVDLPGLTKDDVLTALEDDFLPDETRRVLEIRLALSKASVKKLEAMTRMVDPEDHRIRGTLLFHGASTGRWAGRGIQPQNFPRGSLKPKEVDQAFEALRTHTYEEFLTSYPDVMDTISSMLRGFICAPEGKELTCADFSSIESRGLFWLADEEEGLEVYRSHGKIYEDMAAEIYNRSIEQILKESFERQLGKQAVLGCGYGMGHKKFQATCEGYGMDISKDMAKLAVDSYRAKYPKVVSFWKELEMTAIKAVKDPGRVIKCRKIAWKVQGRFLFCKLPSGRLIAYYRPRLSMKETSWGEMKITLSYMGVNSQTRKWERQHTYGGKLCENVTQAVARDFMAEAMFRVEAEGYETIMTVHDEIVTEADEGFGSLEEFEKLMSIIPEWGEGCPIEAEGWRGKRFKK